MSSRSNVIHFLTVSTSIFGLAGLLSGLVGDNWFQKVQLDNSKTQHFGLLRMCYEVVEFDDRKMNCVGREVLSFSNRHLWKMELSEKILDDILAILTISAIFGVLALVTSLIMSCCCHRNLLTWRFMATVNFMFIAISACFGLAGCGISELHILNRLEKSSKFTYSQDWTSTITWIGCAFLTISTFFSIALFYFTPIKTNVNSKKHNDRRTRYSTDNGIRFNFIMDKSHATNWSFEPDTSSTSSFDLENENTTGPVHIFPLEPTGSLNVSMYSLLEEQRNLPPRYSPTSAELSSPPSYNEAVAQVQ